MMYRGTRSYRVLRAGLVWVTACLALQNTCQAAEFIANGGLARALSGGSRCEASSGAFGSWTLTSGATWYDEDALKTNSMGCPGQTTVTIVQPFALPGSLAYTLSCSHIENQYPSPGTTMWNSGWARATVYYYSDAARTQLIGSDTTGNLVASQRNTWTAATMSRTTPSNCVSAKIEVTAFSTTSGSYYGFTNVDNISLTACVPASIAGHPQSQVKDVGQTALFSVSAGGESLNYQWEKRPAGGAYSAVSGAIGAAYTTPELSLADSGYEYRCKVHNACNTVYSNAAVLTVIAPVAVQTIAQAKGRVDGVVVRLPEKPVSGRTSSAYWIQDDNPPGGIRVNSTAYPTPGARVAVTGTMATSPAGERSIQPLAETWGDSGAAVRPFFLTTKSLGGAGLNAFTPGLYDGYGPHNVGLFAKISGRVTSVAADHYYVDDGAGVRDGTTTGTQPNVGVRIMAPPGGLIPNDWTTVSGLSAVLLNGTDRRRAVIPSGCTAPSVGLPVSPVAAAVCAGGSTGIVVGSTEPDVIYQLRNSSDNTPIGAETAGNGGSISLPTGALTATTTFSVLARRTVGDCSAQLAATATVVVQPLPEAGLAVGATQTQIDVGQSATVTVAGSQVSVNYQLKKLADNSNVGSVVVGTGGTIGLSTGPLSTPGIVTFCVLATGPGGCSRQLTQTVAITVGTVGTLTGIVRTARMQPITGVTVSTIPPTTSAITNSSGRYTLSNIPSGTYNVQYAAAGYQTGTWHDETVVAGTTVTVPDKLLPRNSSKIGAHVVWGSRNGWGAFITQTHGCGKGCQLVKMVDDFGAANDARNYSPETLTVGRKNDTPNYDLQGFDQYADPASPNYTPPAQFAQIIFNELHPYWDQNPQIDVWEICNEWSWWWAYQADFYIAMMDIAEANGHRIAMYGCSGGNPPEAYWPEFARCCARAKAHGGHMLSLHEYSWDGTLLQEHELYGNRLVLRYRRLYNYLRTQDADCPMVLTEVGENGGGGFIGVEPFIADFGWYDDQVRQDDYAFGIAAWTLGNWSGANWQDALPGMADYICAH